MKANLENLKGALEALARAYRAKFEDLSEDEYQLVISGGGGGLNEDIRDVCDAFYGRHDMVEREGAYVTVYLDEADFLADVDEEALMQVFPVGAVA